MGAVVPAHPSRTASPSDAHIGRRIRERRNQRRLSQQGLAEQLGLTFQQVQKYEKGTNRVSASRLVAIAAALDAPVGYFLPVHLPGAPEPAMPPPAQLDTSRAAIAGLIETHLQAIEKLERIRDQLAELRAPEGSDG